MDLKDVSLCQLCMWVWAPTPVGIRCIEVDLDGLKYSPGNKEAMRPKASLGMFGRLVEVLSQ